MSKKDDLAKDLSRGRVRSLKKTINTTEERAARVVEKIAEPNQEVVEKTIRTTMDLPRSVHRAIKMKSAREGISLKDYIVSLVKSDLNLD